MRLVFLLTLLVGQSTQLFPQSRFERPILQWQERGPKLNVATGWAYNINTGKWISNKNAIDPNPVLKGLVGMIDQNFVWMQFAKAASEYEDCIVVMLEKQSGYYKFEAIKEGWVDEKRTYWFAIDSAQYQSIVHLVNNASPSQLVIRSKAHGFIRDGFQSLGGEHLYNDENLRANLTNGIRLGADSDACMVISYAKEENGDVIRFLLPEEMCRYVERMFERKYFEVPVGKFRPILLKLP